MSNPYNNEIIFNGQTLMSLKEDTVTPDKVLAGETFHDRSGAPQTGNLITHNVLDELDSTSTSDALSANQGRELNEKYSELNRNVANLTETGSWTPSIPRATFTVLNGKYYRVGNLVHLHAAINVTASQTSNAYIDYSSIPAFGKTRSYATGSWMDNSSDKCGQIVSSGNLNCWFSYQGATHPLTDHVGHNIIISIIYSLY